MGDVLFWSTTLGWTELASGIASDIVMPRCPSFVKVSTQAYGLCEGAGMTFGQGYAPVGYFLWHLSYKSRLKVKWYQGSRNSVLESLHVSGLNMYHVKFHDTHPLSSVSDFLSAKQLQKNQRVIKDQRLQRAVFLILLKSLAGDQCPRVYRVSKDCFWNHNFHFH